jgi:uncharacterized protein
MNQLATYNAFRPLLPRRLKIRLRQHAARRKRESVDSEWPILERAGHAPAGWQGWPAGKQFAFIISHDVDTKRGFDRCLLLAEMEDRLGFRSCFYFVPEGRYTPCARLMHQLVSRGFEIGVHGLYHDWQTFRDRRVFERRAPRINAYLKEWHAVGFRAPSMISNLNWIRELDVGYDASTFDTDPFEPQPLGAETIFPFWVNGLGNRPGYIELPYTLTQDYTLFVLLQEKTADVWKRKLAWIARKGGMALIDVHPCYAAPNGAKRTLDSYPLELYEDFLRHVRDEYGGTYWHGLPKDVSRFWRSLPGSEGGVNPLGAPAPTPGTQHPYPIKYHAATPGTRPPVPGIGQRATKPGRRIWIDLDNTPHVPFFKPIIRELEKRGYSVLVTARDAFQVWELADRLGVPCTKIGRHYGKHRLLKGIGICCRAAQLAPLVRREMPRLAVSHGSRSQIVLASLLHIPSVMIIDYEHVGAVPMFSPIWYLIPDVIPAAEVKWDPARLLRYPGIKEDVYVPDFMPDPTLRQDLGLNPAETVVTVRPPATEAHYHCGQSDVLFDATMSFLLTVPGIRVILLPRNKKQEAHFRAMRPGWFVNSKVIVPWRALDGLNLLWHSDVVISGGGTMNREAAALGVPVYSIFGGAIGAVDRHLAETGRLGLIASVEDIPRKIVLARRPRYADLAFQPREALRVIVDQITQLAGGEA